MTRLSFFLVLTLIILFSSCFANASSQGIKISPTKTSLNIKLGEAKCTIIYFLPDNDTSVETRWSEEKFNGSNPYTLSNEAIKLRFNYTKLNFETYEFCFEPKQKGYFYGVIFFQPKGSLIKLGTWIEMNVESESIVKKISLITGNIISKEASGTNILMVLVVLLLLTTLILMIKKL